MIEGEFLLTVVEHNKPIFIQKCMIDNSFLNNDIISIVKEDFDYEFEIISMYNVIDNGVHRIKFSLSPLYKNETKEIIRKLKILNV